jgi:hypothetical protein
MLKDVTEFDHGLPRCVHTFPANGMLTHCLLSSSVTKRTVLEFMHGSRVIFLGVWAVGSHRLALSPNPTTWLPIGGDSVEFALSKACPGPVSA